MQLTERTRISSLRSSTQHLDELAKLSRLQKALPRGRTVDLMGGPTSRYGDDVINFDLRATNGIADSVESFGRHFPPKSVPRIVADNPQARFLPHVVESLEDAGSIVIRGNRSNRFVREILDGTADGLDGFNTVQPGKTIPNPGNYLRTDGTPVQGTIWEIILEKKL